MSRAQIMFEKSYVSCFDKIYSFMNNPMQKYFVHLVMKGIRVETTRLSRNNKII